MTDAPMPEPALAALARTLRDRQQEQRYTHGYVARRIGRDRSRVSRVLAGQDLPTRDITLKIAGVLDLDRAAVQRMWERAAAAVEAARLRRASGMPPDDCHDYHAFCSGLRHLIDDSGISQRELTRRDPTLARATVGAVLRGERSASRQMVVALVRACGVTDDHAVAAWDAAWWRFGRPHRLAQAQRRLDGYDRLTAPYRPPWWR
jgi:plasmid maintenance system antidote protein VapI